MYDKFSQEITYQQIAELERPAGKTIAVCMYVCMFCRHNICQQIADLKRPAGKTMVVCMYACSQEIIYQQIANLKRPAGKTMAVEVSVNARAVTLVVSICTSMYHLSMSMYVCTYKHE